MTNMRLVTISTKLLYDLSVDSSTPARAIFSPQRRILGNAGLASSRHLYITEVTVYNGRGIVIGTDNWVRN